MMEELEAFCHHLFLPGNTKIPLFCWTDCDMMILPHKLNIVAQKWMCFFSVKTHPPFRIHFWALNLCGNKRRAAFFVRGSSWATHFLFSQKRRGENNKLKERYGEMKTASEMDRYCLSHGFSYNGKSALKHFNVIEKVLANDEECLVSMAPNSVYNGGTIVMGGITAIAFTNKRFIYGQQSMIRGELVKIVSLDQVNDIQKEPLLFDGNIKIDTIRENIVFSLQKKQIDEAFSTVMEVLENYKQNQIRGGVVIQRMSPAEEILKYKELLDMGALSQEEFDAKKKQLMGV